GAMGVARNLVSWVFIIVTCTCVASVVVPVAAVLRVLRRRWAERWGDFTVWWWTGALAKLWGVEVEVHGREHLDPDQAYVIVCPHRSHLDAVAAVSALFWRVPFGVIVKRSLTLIPIWGWFIWLVGYVPVDRGRGRRGKRDP